MKFYLINEYGKHLKTIKYWKGNVFEWNTGYATIEQLKENTDTKSKVKLILNLL